MSARSPIASQPRKRSSAIAHEGFQRLRHPGRAQPSAARSSSTWIVGPSPPLAIRACVARSKSKGRDARLSLSLSRADAENWDDDEDDIDVHEVCVTLRIALLDFFTNTRSERPSGGGIHSGEGVFQRTCEPVSAAVTSIVCVSLPPPGR